MINWTIVIVGIVISILGLGWLWLTIYFKRSTKESHLKELYKNEWITKMVLSVLIFIGGLTLICYQLFPIVFRYIKPEGTYYVESYTIEPKHNTSLDQIYTYDYVITAKLSDGIDYSFGGLWKDNIIIDNSTNQNYIIVSHKEFNYGIDDVAILYITPTEVEYIYKIEKDYRGWTEKKKSIN